MTTYFRFTLYRVILPITIVGIIIFLPFKLAMASVNLIPIEDAINRQVCFESFWWDDEYIRLGKTVTMAARQDGNTTYVWSNDLSVEPFVRQSTYFFTMVSKGNQSIVGESLGFNTDVMQNTPLYKEKMKEVFAKGAVSFKLHLPSTCTPQFLPDNRLKALMLADIIKSLLDELASSRPHNPHHLEVIIANFNVTDPGTFAFIPSTKEFFSIALRDPDDPFSNVYLRLGGFPTLDQSNTPYASEVIPKVIKYGKSYWISK
jgi:hypothetical protein